MNEDEREIIARLETSSSNSNVLQEIPSNQLVQSVRGQKKAISKKLNFSNLFLNYKNQIKCQINHQIR